MNYFKFICIGFLAHMMVRRQYCCGGFYVAYIVILFQSWIYMQTNNSLRKTLLDLDPSPIQTIRWDKRLLPGRIIVSKTNGHGVTQLRTNLSKHIRCFSSFSFLLNEFDEHLILSGCLHFFLANKLEYEQPHPSLNNAHWTVSIY